MLAEDSQKEKHRREQPGTCHILASPALSKNDPTELGSGSAPFHQYGDSPLTASAGKVIGEPLFVSSRNPCFQIITCWSLGTSFQSPPTIATRVLPLSRSTTSMPVGNKQFRRSPSFPSQDSFGGPVSQDPAELYLASAKQFNVPLSDLGETPTQEVVHSPTDSRRTLPDASEHKEFLEAAMRKYEAQRANRATANRGINILVAATPSSSGESSSMSQHKDDDFSFHNHPPEFFGQESRFEFNGSSSFDKMLDRDLADAPDPTPDPSPPEEIQATQADGTIGFEPTVKDDIPTTPPWSSKQRSPPFEWIAPTPSAAVASSNPRSLLRMVHPGNRYRIEKMRNLAGAVEPPSFVTMGAETQRSRMEETQPCHVDESTYSDVPPTRPLPHQTMTTSSRPTAHRPRGENEDDEPGDALDIVPDSEPLRAGSSTQTPSRYAVGQSSPKKLFRPFSPVPEHGSGDLVPDSLEVEESEADVPLVIEAASRNAKLSLVPTEDVAVHGRKTRIASTVPAKVICFIRSMTLGPD